MCQLLGQFHRFLALVGSRLLRRDLIPDFLLLFGGQRLVSLQLFFQFLNLLVRVEQELICVSLLAPSLFALPILAKLA